MPLNSTLSKTYQFFIFTVIFFLFPVNMPAQEYHHHDVDEIHNELGTGVGIAFSSENRTVSPSFHFHATKGLSQILGIGIGYESILGDEPHHSFAVLLNYKPLELIDINVGPGILLPAGSEPLSLILNTELAFTYHLNMGIHMGPGLDVGFSKHGLHAIAGIHIGIDL